VATHCVDEKHYQPPKSGHDAPYAAFWCCNLLFPDTAYCSQTLLTVPRHYCSFYSCSYSFYRIYRISGFYRFGSKFGQIVEY